MSDNEASDSEEEILVYAEFEDSINISNYRSIHVLGINERNPIIQMDETFFTGKYENSLGTYMFFEEDPEPECLDPLLDRLPEKNLKYIHKTRKLLHMEDAYVTPKGSADEDVQNQLKQEDDHIKPISFKTIQEGLEMIKKKIAEETDSAAKLILNSERNMLQDKNMEPATEGNAKQIQTRELVTEGNLLQHETMEPPTKGIMPKETIKPASEVMEQD